ncbi:MAG: Zn-dependent exopeptidase M28 [Proteobacteria bacterium]|nr:Zn-dependent exopeptidase M28 [Pseudomonadota bacterium]
MKRFIVDVIEKTGGRLAGSPQEEAGQEMARQAMGKFCHQVETQRFSAPMESIHGSLRGFSAGFLAALALAPLSLTASFLVALVNAFFFLGHFLSMRYWLDLLFKKSESSNVEGVIEPREDVRATVIFAGHMDSTTEYRFWHHLGMGGIALTWLASVLILLLPAFLGLDLFFSRLAEAPLPVWLACYRTDFLLLSPSLAVLWWMRSDRVVPGAQDNLSGVAAALGAARVLAGAGEDWDAETVPAPVLSHTRVRVVSFGAEEAGLRGSHAYAREFKDRLLEENAVLVNLDGILRDKDLAIVKAEIMLGVRFPRQVVADLGRAFLGVSRLPKYTVIPQGATDGASFTRAGIPAVSILGLPTSRLDPTYHSRRDTPEHVEDQALATTRDVLVQFAKNLDKRVSGKEE